MDYWYCFFFEFRGMSYGIIYKECGYEGLGGGKMASG